MLNHTKNSQVYKANRDGGRVLQGLVKRRAAEAALYGAR